MTGRWSGPGEARPFSPSYLPKARARDGEVHKVRIDQPSPPGHLDQIDKQKGLETDDPRIGLSCNPDSKP